ncbi:MAG: S8 family serine peptidase, partial [Bacteroidaceae bacterium]|nr:S8 family serine peptidase [Bacteroidaceae bacterium]
MLYILILMVPFAASAQRKNLYEKMSATTMMLMNDLQEDEEENKAFAKNVANAKLRIKDKKPKVSERFARGKHRTYAAPDTIDGKAYISSFLRVHDDARVAELQSLGVKIQSRFKNGLMTVLIPLDKIEDVASLNNVKRINVSSVAQPESDGAMEAIHADDVLKLTNNALEAGLTKKYDGKGILLAVIDVGVDFQHIAFRDSVGNLRLKGAYVYDDNGEREVTDFDELTTDNSQNDHGTHVASLAGGSRVIIDGNDVKVTNDADSATLSGVAPAADLYLCGLQDLNYTSIANALNVICNYADAHNQSLVVCGSWGSHDGPHDGTGDFADVINQYFGDEHPNRVIVFASGNYAGKSKKGDGGGFFISGNASTEAPLGTIMRCNHLEGYDDGRTYDGIIASAWARSSDVDSLACRLYVLDNKTGKILASQEIRADDAISTDNQSKKCAKAQFSDYYRNDLYVYFEIDKAQKAVVRIKGSNFTAKKSAVSEVNGVRLNRSNYTLAVEFFPVEGSTVIDVWGGNKSYFTNHLTTAGHDWVDGTDDYTITDESSYENGISVGAYASTNFSVDYNGVTHDVSKDYQVGEIASISSYAVPGVGPVSETLPTITAPGVLLVAAVNRYNGDSSYMSGYSYGNSSICRSNASTQHPYGSMTGTSMATPLAVGAVVLWMQAANELGKSLTVRDVKEVMQATAIHDEFTEGVNGSHFGNGKLDVLAGLQYILSNYADTISDTIPDVKKPSLSVSADTLSFSAKLGESAAQILKVTGTDLIDSVHVSVMDSLGV